MKNRFFQEMQRAGIRYRKGKQLKKNAYISNFDISPPFSEGQSFAYKFWAIADRYNANEIIVDDLPCSKEISKMLDTFVAAGIENIVVKEEHKDIAESLQRYGCRPICECKVFRQETILYLGEVETIKGILMKIHD